MKKMRQTLEQNFSVTILLLVALVIMASCTNSKTNLKVDIKSALPLLNRNQMSYIPEIEGLNNTSNNENFQQIDGNRKVLLIGDSHVTQTFGSSLDLLLRSTPRLKVKTVGSCGVRPEAFMKGKKTACGFVEIEEDKIQRQVIYKTPLLESLIQDFHPDLVIVALGANLIHKATSQPERARMEIKLLTEKISKKSECIWIGPPYGLNQQKPFVKMEKVYQLLKETLPQNCVFLDSRPQKIPFLDYQQLAKKAGRWGDGRHFDQLGAVGKHAARQWALHMFRLIQPRIKNLVAKRNEPISKNTVALQLLEYEK